MSKYNFRVAELTELADRKSKDLRTEFDVFSELGGKSVVETVFFLGVYYLFCLRRKKAISKEAANEIFKCLRDKSNRLTFETSAFDDSVTLQFCTLHSKLAAEMKKKKYKEALFTAMQMLNIANTPQDSIDYVELFNYETKSEHEDLD